MLSRTRQAWDLFCWRVWWLGLPVESWRVIPFPPAEHPNYRRPL